MKKLSSTYRRASTPKLLTLSRNVLAAMRKTAVYSRLPPGVSNADQLEAGILKCRTFYEGALTHDSNMIRERNAAQAELIKVLDSIRSFLEMEAVNDPNAFYDTGFEIANGTGRNSNKMAALLAVYNLSVNHGPKSGTLIGKAIRQGSSGIQARSFEIQVAEGDPLVEANWLHKAVFAGTSSMYMDGYTRGNEYSLRGRGVFPAGMGGWSPVVTIIVV
jgi:hypothetical protein